MLDKLKAPSLDNLSSHIVIFCVTSFDKFKAKSFADWYDQGDGWVITGGNVASSTLGSYEGSMSLTAVALDADGNNLAEVSSISGDNYSGDLLGVFDPSGGLRGVVHTTAPPFGTYAGQAQFLCLIGGVAGDNGSAFTLKLYDASSDSVIDIDQTVTFSVNDIQGSCLLYTSDAADE